MNFKKTLPVMGATLILSATGLMASAQTARIANQGDALSMDPHSLNESLQLSVTGNIYEGPRAGACLGHVLEADLAERVAI